MRGRAANTAAPWRRCAAAPRLRAEAVSGRCAAFGGLLAAVLAAPAAALSPAEHLDRFDANGDGRVDRAEFQAYLIAGFDARDRNRNGILDIDEQPAGHARKPLPRQQQWQAYGEQFERQDVDGDGHLDLFELLAPPR